MHTIEKIALEEIAARTGVAVEDVVRLAVCRLIDEAYDSQVTKIQDRLVPELKAELELTRAGRHGVTLMLEQRAHAHLEAAVAEARRAREEGEASAARSRRANVALVQRALRHALRLDPSFDAATFARDRGLSGSRAA